MNAPFWKNTQLLLLSFSFGLLCTLSSFDMRNVSIESKPRPPKRTLVGTYENTSLFTFEELVFCEDLSFTYQEESCGMRSVGEGNYVLTKDSLFLFFDSPLEKSIGLTVQAITEGETDQLSTIGVFGGHKHRNDIQFDYTVFYKDSTNKRGTGNCYHPLSFGPDSVSTIDITTYLRTRDTLILARKHHITITSDIPHRYTLLERSDPTAMYLGPLFNKRYKIKRNKAGTGFTLHHRDQRSEYQRTSD